MNATKKKNKLIAFVLFFSIGNNAVASKQIIFQKMKLWLIHVAKALSFCGQDPIKLHHVTENMTCDIWHVLLVLCPWCHVYCTICSRCTGLCVACMVFKVEKITSRLASAFVPASWLLVANTNTFQDSLAWDQETEQQRLKVLAPGMSEGLQLESAPFVFEGCVSFLCLIATVWLNEGIIW